MSIKPLRFSELSDELADAVGLYDAAAMDLEEIDTTILDQTLIAHVGGGGEDLMTAGGIAEEDREPAPVTPQLDMTFTSSSRAPIAPP